MHCTVAGEWPIPADICYTERRFTAPGQLLGTATSPNACGASNAPLLPEVWLHWDPRTVKERGPNALLRFRMDFLLLLPHGTRVVIEVDGKHHYADPHPVGRAKSPTPGRVKIPHLLTA